MRRRTALVVIISIVMVAVAGCERKPSATAEKVVRIGSFSVAVDYGPYLVAKNKHWFEDDLKTEGIKPEYTLFQSLPPINEALATDKVDIVFEAESPAIVGRAAGIDLRIVALSCTLVQEIVVPKASSVQSPAGLKGKKIAVLAGTSSHYGLLKVLGRAGVRPNEVEVVDMVPPDAKNAFETGKVDAWAVWPPWVEQEEVSGVGRVLPGGQAVVHSVMVARSKFAETHPDILRKIVHTLDRARSWIRENPAAAQQVVAQELNIPQEVVQKAWPRHDWAATISDAIIADTAEKAKFLLDRGSIKNPVDARALFDTTYQRP